MFHLTVKQKLSGKIESDSCISDCLKNLTTKTLHVILGKAASCFSSIIGTVVFNPKIIQYLFGGIAISYKGRISILEAKFVFPSHAGQLLLLPYLNPSFLSGRR